MTTQFSTLGKYAFYSAGGMVLTTLSFLLFNVTPLVYQLEQQALAFAADDVVVHSELDEVRDNLQQQLGILIRGQHQISVSVGKLESHWEDHKDFHKYRDHHHPGPLVHTPEVPDS